jgi:putative acetyltransferase
MDEKIKIKISKTIIQSAETPDDIAWIRNLFLAYAESLGFDLCFQGFEEELNTLPGSYAPPDGRLYLALRDDQTVGCVALHRFESNICEMKRLYVVPAVRGTGHGRKLCEQIIQDARCIGYAAMRLDTLASMKEARALYASLGFAEIPPYRFNPLAEAVYMELLLR